MMGFFWHEPTVAEQMADHLLTVVAIIFGIWFWSMVFRGIACGVRKAGEIAEKHPAVGSAAGVVTKAAGEVAARAIMKKFKL